MENYGVRTDIPIYHDNTCRLKTKEEIRDYVEGGKGVFTLYSPTGNYRTYSFRRPVEDIFKDDEFYEGALFVYCRVSSGVWMYVGMYCNNKFRMTQASRFPSNHPITKGARYIVRMMNNDLAASGPMEIYHEGVCCVCGRKLTHPKSIRRGVGPQCKKKRFPCQLSMDKINSAS